MRRPRWIIRPQTLPQMPPPAIPTTTTNPADPTGLAAPPTSAPANPQLNPPQKPTLYHCISRVVDRRFVLEATEKEKLRNFMRMYETFTGNRVLAYCFMSNHLHLLLEITPPPPGGLTDDELLTRLRAIQTPAQVALVDKELADARKAIADGLTKHGDAALHAIHQRHTWRMHDLSEFMKSFLQRYTQWHNKRHERRGHLWEDRFKSVIVEDGIAARTIAAYIDLNPVRAGIVQDPADYRWSSYGEAIAGGIQGNGKKARGGLVRALRAHRGLAADDAHWKSDVATEYRNLLLLGAGETLETRIDRSGKPSRITLRKGMTAEALQKARAHLHETQEQQLSEIPYGKMLRCRINYFTAGAVIGTRDFVEDLFATTRHRFGPKRKTGARKLRGPAAPAAGILWSLRDLREKRPDHNADSPKPSPTEALFQPE